jgi:peptidoglycan hydrolase-like protein with peptidoglycan-binding domain
MRSATRRGGAVASPEPHGGLAGVVPRQGAGEWGGLIRTTGRRNAVWSRLRTVAAAIVLAVVAVGGAVCLSPSPAQAALPTCNEAVRKASPSGKVMFVPVYYATLSKDCVMRRGNINNGVRYLQLIMRDQYDKNIAVDGNFGGQTEAALRSLQGELCCGLITDGIYGRQTRDAICWPLYYSTGCWWIDE